MNEDTKIEAERRIRNSMDHLREAQVLIDRAAIRISCVSGRGVSDEWQRLRDLYESLKTHLHDLRKLLIDRRFDLDTSATEAFLKHSNTQAI